MDKKETVKYREEAMELAAFIKESPTPFHVTANIGVILEKEGFMPLQESRKWEMKAGGKYYVTRNHSSIIAFEIGKIRQIIIFRLLLPTAILLPLR